MELETNSDEIYYYNGITKIWTDFDWEAGESSFRKCLEINPNFSEARAYYSHLMMILKRPEEMREQMQLALQNDPKNLLIKVLATVELMVELEFDSCITQAAALQQIMPNNPLLMLALFICYTETEQYDMAINELTKVFGQLADEKVIQTLQETYQNQGFEEALIASADEWIARSDFVTPQHAIMLYAYGGDEENMLFWLDRGYIRNDPSNPYLGVQPYLRFYHDNPRYTEILQRMNLPLGPFPQ
jgi:tetratricopeptide (TPR) repeat protein